MANTTPNSEQNAEQPELDVDGVAASDEAVPAQSVPQAEPEVVPEEVVAANPVVDDVVEAAPPPESLEDIADIKEEWLYAMLAYLSVLILVPILTRREDPFVNFHIRQGLLVLGMTISALVLTIWFPRVGGMLFLLSLIVSIVGAVMTLQGRQWKIPGLGHIAELYKI